MPQMIRKKIKWATKRRKCGSRVWKTKWVTVAQQTPKAPKPERGEKPAEKHAEKHTEKHVEKHAEKHVEKHVEKKA